MASLNAVNGVTVEGVVTVTREEDGGGCDLCGGFDLDLLGTRPPKSWNPLPKNSVGMNEVCEASSMQSLIIHVHNLNYSEKAPGVIRLHSTLGPIAADRLKEIRLMA